MVNGRGSHMSVPFLWLRLQAQMGGSGYRNVPDYVVGGSLVNMDFGKNQV